MSLTRRLSVLVLLITAGGLGAGLALLVAPEAESAYVWPEFDQGLGPAHVWPEGGHQGLYTYDSNTCKNGSRTDPINIIFHGPFGEPPFVDVHASDSSHGGWSNHSGGDQYFSDHEECELMDGANADGGSLSDRWHMRYNQGLDVDPVWEQYTVAAAHHEDFIILCPGHAVDGNVNDPPGGFNHGRAEIWFNWTQVATDPHANTWQEDWDNVKRFKQCDGDFAWSNGLVFHIEILCTGADPTVGVCDPDTTRVSESSSGEEGNGNSQLPAISSDGRFVAFQSGASNLVAGDTNGATDVFVQDSVTGFTERVSVDSNGVEANGFNNQPTISSDGRFVAFESDASNLVSDDTNSFRDIFVHDRLTGITERVSVDSGGGEADSGSEGAAISGDGRFVAFVSFATDLVPGDANVKQDAFVHDRETGFTGRVSVDSGGGEANDHSWSVAISFAGGLVAFESWASNLVTSAPDGVFVYDLQSGLTELVSVNSSGSPANDLSQSPSISADGRYVAYWTLADNLVAGDNNNRDDVFVYDRETGLTKRVSVDSGGEEADGNSLEPAISPDGRFVVFDSVASNLVPNDTNGAGDIFLHDRLTGITQRVSVSSSGGEATGSSRFPAVNMYGTVVAFHSSAPDLIAIDTNGAADVFVRSSTTDSDGDGLPDAADPCPTNPDCDGDGWSDWLEAFMGTAPGVACPATSTANDELVDAWGPDFDDNRIVNSLDAFLFAQRFGSTTTFTPAGKLPYEPRYDLNADDAINSLDTSILSLYFNTSCS